MKELRDACSSGCYINNPNCSPMIVVVSNIVIGIIILALIFTIGISEQQLKLEQVETPVVKEQSKPLTLKTFIVVGPEDQRCLLTD